MKQQVHKHGIAVRISSSALARLGILLAVALIVAVLAPASAVKAQGDSGGGASVGAGVAAAADAGPVDIVVAFDAPSGTLGGGGAAQAIARQQNQVARALSSDSSSAVAHRFTHLPGMVLTVDSVAAVEQLASMPGIRAIDLDEGGSGGLNVSVPLTGADTRHAAGNEGDGVIVAVLDSGVDTDHPDLVSDLVPAASHRCFGWDGGSSAFGFCPDGTELQAGAGSVEDDQGHGTHVAGIITSDGVVSSPGFAPGAEILPIKMLDSNNSFASFTRNIVAPLDYLIDNPQLGVDVINMSLVTNAVFSNDCDTATSWLILGAAAVDTLRDRGVLSFVSSGNASNKSQMSAPACLSNAIAVGASNDFDIEASFSNVSPTTDIFGPGVGIIAPYLNGGTASLSGTSMASPSAAGCAALLIESGEATTPDTIEQRLESSAAMVTASNGMSYPRFDCGFTAPTGYFPIAPTRLLDTRAAPLQTGEYSTPWGPTTSRPIQIAGQANVPAGGVGAVALHVTTVNPAAGTMAGFSWLNAYPSGGAPATTAVHNFGTDAATTELVNDLLIVGVGSDGKIRIDNQSGEVDLVIDVVGYFGPGGDQYLPTNGAVRIIDSRPGVPGGAIGPFDTPWPAAPQTRSVTVAGSGTTVPAGATAIAMHVTTVRPTAGTMAPFSWLNIYPTGATPTTTAVHNFGTAAPTTELVNDLLIAKIGDNGQIDISNAIGEVDLVIDVVGYFIADPAGSLYQPLTPKRVLNTRDNGVPVSAGQTIVVTDPAMVGCAAAALHITSINPAAGGMSAFSWLEPVSAGTASAVHNFGTNPATSELVNDLVIGQVTTSTGGVGVEVKNANGSVDLIVDLVGLYDSQFTATNSCSP